MENTNLGGDQEVISMVKRAQTKRRQVVLVLIAVLIAVVAVISITSCAAQTTPEDSDTTQVSDGGNTVDRSGVLKSQMVTMPNGERVMCVYIIGSNKAALTCDWANAR